MDSLEARSGLGNNRLFVQDTDILQGSAGHQSLESRSEPIPRSAMPNFALYPCDSEFCGCYHGLRTSVDVRPRCGYEFPRHPETKPQSRQKADRDNQQWPSTCALCVHPACPLLIVHWAWGPALHFLQTAQYVHSCLRPAGVSVLGQACLLSVVFYNGMLSAVDNVHRGPAARPRPERKPMQAIATTAQSLPTDLLPAPQPEAFLQGNNHLNQDPVLRELDTVVRTHTPLVKHLARRFAGYGLPLADLVSEGTLGLLTAARKYDPGRGAQFSTYAGYLIDHRMRRALDCQAPTIRIPCGTVDRIRALRQARADLRNQLGREPSAQELADKLKTDVPAVKRLLHGDVRAYSFSDAQDGHTEGERPVYDLPDTRQPSPAAAAMERDSRAFMHRTLDQLPEREATIVTMYFGIDDTAPQTHVEISRQLGVSAERVRQLLKRALQRLRAVLLDQRHELAPLLAC